MSTPLTTSVYGSLNTLQGAGRSDGERQIIHPGTETHSTSCKGVYPRPLLPSSSLPTSYGPYTGPTLGSPEQKVHGSSTLCVSFLYRAPRTLSYPNISSQLI